MKLNSRDLYLIQVAIKNMAEGSSDRRKLELDRLLEKIDTLEVDSI